MTITLNSIFLFFLIFFVTENMFALLKHTHTGSTSRMLHSFLDVFKLDQSSQIAAHAGCAHTALCE